MRTISIPLSKLIKFIPSGPDGGVIPGKVLWCERPQLRQANSYTLELSYMAQSTKERRGAICRLDEELEIVRHSNAFFDILQENRPSLYEDGITYLFMQPEPRWVGDNVEVHWEDLHLAVPSPFGVNKLSNFVPCGRVQIACCYMGHGIHIAIIGNDFHKITDKPLIVSQIGADTFEPMTFGAPCQHGDEWLIPWQSKSKGINITRMQASEMDSFIDASIALPKT